MKREAADEHEHEHEDEAPGRHIDVFLHIPKAVGTTLRHILLANAWASTRRLGNVFKGSGGYAQNPQYSRRISVIRTDKSARLITGHIPIAIRDAMPSAWKTRWFTILRDPVERAISHYYEIVRAEHAMPSRNDKRPSVLTIGYVKALNGVDYVPDNLQTRMLCGLPEPFGEMTEDHLQMAIANVERLSLVGVAERFDESLALLERRFGYHLINYQSQRVNLTRPRAGDVPEELRVAARRANELDARLYEHATQLFDGYSELADPNLQIQVEALRRVRRPSSHEPATEPPAYFGGDAVAWSWLVAAHEELILERTARLRAQQQNWAVKHGSRAAVRTSAIEGSELERLVRRAAAKKRRVKMREEAAKAKNAPTSRADKRPPSTPGR